MILNIIFVLTKVVFNHIKILSNTLIELKKRTALSIVILFSKVCWKIAFNKKYTDLK